MPMKTRKSTSSADPDIHPELTLEQIKQPVEQCQRKKMKKHHHKNQELDINTMFDFHSRLGLKTLASSSALVTTLNAERTTSKPPAASARRSSIAVIGAERQRKKDYFETHHLNLHSSSRFHNC